MANPSARIFISTVSNEFKTFRERLAEDLRFPGVDVQTQEENITKLAAGQTILIKLDDYIADCDAVIHLIGQQTGKDGTPASKDAIDDLLQRHPDFGVIVGLKEDELRALSYTQWEAWLAFYHRKTKRPELKLIIATPTAAFVSDHPAHAATAPAQKLSQARHEKELQQRGRYTEINFGDAKELSIAILRALKDILPGQQQPQRIASTRLISRHTAADFLGRDKELALLDDAWNQKLGTTNILSIIAWGGVGKTALLAYWVQSRFVQHGWQSVVQPSGLSSEEEEEEEEAVQRTAPHCYFDWTFYDQGTRSDDATHAGAASVGTFFQSALKHFGDPDPESPHDKAARLARLIQAQRSLLVLDGLEPLQYPLNHPQAGQLTDPDLRELLGLLAQRNPGLVIISSRQALTDFTCGAATPTRQHDLEELPVEFAVALLRKMQIIGTDQELKEAAEDYFCHALSLIVLGRFLFVKGGDIRIRKEIPLERANENRNQSITRNAWHVLEAYEQWLTPPKKWSLLWWKGLFSRKGKARAEDLQALRLTGLFDRPASPDCLAALRRAPAIPGLTDQLVPLSADAWNAVLLRLHEAHLLQLRFPPVALGGFAPRPEAREVTVDVHPLVREYFAKQLRNKTDVASCAAHARLFNHLCRTTEHQPDTLEGLQPLYQAVVHGCRAGLQKLACEKVYRDRILRGTGDDGYYSTNKLGAIGADLGAVATFFQRTWSHPHPNLSEPQQAWLLNEAAFNLRALGRLTEARDPTRVGLEMGVAAKDWGEAARRGSNLSELEVTLGLLGDAVTSARRALAFADKSGKWEQRMKRMTTAADALHQSGATVERKEACRLFVQAESLQREHHPELNLLYSLWGFRYCDLILAPAERGAWKFVAGVRYSGRVEKGRPSQINPTTSASETTHVRPWLVESAYNQSLAEAQRRATLNLERSAERGFLLDIALDHLTLARVALYRTLLSSHPEAGPSDGCKQYANSHPNSTEPERCGDGRSQCIKAIIGLRKAGDLTHLPRALLTGALHHHLSGDAAAAGRALDETQQIAVRGPMPLFLADVHLHRARIFHNKAELTKARALIERHGYGRRKEELEDAEAVSAHW